MKWQCLALLGIGMLVSVANAQETLPPLKKSGGGTTTKSSPPATTKSNPPANTKTGSSTNPGSPTTSAAPRTTPATGAAPAATTSANALKDHASYAIGLDLAARFKAEGSELNPEMLARGLKDGFTGAKPLFTEQQMRTAMELFQKELEVRAQQQLQQFAAENKTFLAENKKKPAVKSTKSGLQYTVLKSGTGKTPKTTDTIKAHYHGTLIDGSVFDTTNNQNGQPGEPIEIPVEDTIPGWTEALQMMKVGDKWRLFVPPDLAYGDAGFQTVPPHATLIFDLDLIGIVQPDKADAGKDSANKLPAGKETTAKGSTGKDSRPNPLLK